MSESELAFVKADALNSFEYLHRNGYDGLDIAIGTIQALRQFVLDCTRTDAYDDSIFLLTEILKTPVQPHEQENENGSQ